MLLGFRRFGGKGSLVVCLIGADGRRPRLGVVALSAAARRLRPFQEVVDYRERGEPTSAGQRLEFWRKSADFIAEAPVIGHGTGTIETLFRRAAAARAGSALVTANPHSQVFGGGGATWASSVPALLIAMWLAHLALFTAATPMAWFGLIVVAQNIVGSLFNSHISDFTQGWIYVIGVGVLGGAAALRAQPPDRPAAT